MTALVLLSALLATLLATCAAVPVLYWIADRIAWARLRCQDPERPWPTWPADVTEMARVEEELLNKEPALKANEYDVVTRWRRFLHWRPGEVAAIKRRLRRRGRHRMKRTIRRGDENL